MILYDIYCVDRNGCKKKEARLMVIHYKCQHTLSRNIKKQYRCIIENNSINNIIASHIVCIILLHVIVVNQLNNLYYTSYNR